MPTTNRMKSQLDASHLMMASLSSLAVDEAIIGAGTGVAIRGGHGLPLPQVRNGARVARCCARDRATGMWLYTHLAGSCRSGSPQRGSAVAADAAAGAERLNGGWQSHSPPYRPHRSADVKTTHHPPTVPGTRR